MHNPVVIIPAYGRTYESFEALQKDWNDGKDFRIANGPYLSKRDLPTLRARQYTSVIYMWMPKSGELCQMTLPLSDSQVTT